VAKLLPTLLLWVQLSETAEKNEHDYLLMLPSIPAISVLWPLLKASMGLYIALQDRESVVLMWCGLALTNAQIVAKRLMKTMNLMMLFLISSQEGMLCTNPSYSAHS